MGESKGLARHAFIDPELGDMLLQCSPSIQYRLVVNVVHMTPQLYCMDNVIINIRPSIS